MSFKIHLKLFDSVGLPAGDAQLCHFFRAEINFWFASMECWLHIRPFALTSCHPSTINTACTWYMKCTTNECNPKRNLHITYTHSTKTRNINWIETISAGFQCASAMNCVFCCKIDVTAHKVKSITAEPFHPEPKIPKIKVSGKVQS